MKISKTDFMKIVKFDLEGVETVLQNNNITSTDKMIELEKRNRIKEFSAGIGVIEEDEEKGDDIDEELKMLMPFYNRLEQEVGKLVTNKFGGNVLYGEHTYDQKLFSHLKDTVELYCFVDVYQEDDDTIRIFETKATTSTRFSKDNDRFYFASKSGSRRATRNDFFVQNEEGIYVPFEVTGQEFPEESDYQKRKQKIQDVFDDRGVYLYDLAFQRYVIERSLETNKPIKYHLVILNHEYIYDGTRDENGKEVFTEDLVRIYDMTKIVEEMETLIEKDVEFLNENSFNPDLRQEVINRYKKSGISNQSVLKEIFKEEVAQPNSVFNYIGRHYGFGTGDDKVSLNGVLLEKGWTKALDVPEDYITREINVIQREAIKTGKPFLNESKISAAIDTLTYPIYHLDFETFNSPLPRFKGEGSYDQSLFQFSVHIEREPGVCDFEEDNISFLAGDHEDHREELLLELLKAIPEGEGTVLVYNASFEKGRLEELQALFPEHKDHIQNIIDRLFDLLYVVRGNESFYTELGFERAEAKVNNFYDHRQQGSYSLKYVLPVLTDVSYQDLEVADGTQAMVTYGNFPNMDKETFEKKYEALLFYCKQDTYAMFEVLNKLREMV